MNYKHSYLRECRHQNVDIWIWKYLMFVKELTYKNSNAWKSFCISKCFLIILEVWKAVHIKGKVLHSVFVFRNQGFSTNSSCFALNGGVPFLWKTEIDLIFMAEKWKNFGRLRTPKEWWKRKYPFSGFENGNFQ